MAKYKAVFFDLFFTLIIPSYNLQKNENDVLGITVDQWEKYAEDDKLYYNRAIGNEMNSTKIISEIIKTTPYEVNDNEIQEILQLRQERMRQALKNVDEKILYTIKKLHNENIKIGLISNADIIDCIYWNESELSKWFHHALFSCHVKSLKPSKEIYIEAIKKMNLKPSECIFVGDGGSDELKGAKDVGMDTIFTEYLDKKSFHKKILIQEFADYHITDFCELISIVDIK